MTSDSLYERLVDYYDWEHHDFQDDVPLYLGYAQSTGGPVLDAGCGTGRLLAPLAQAGYDIVGLDSSHEMLRVAATRAAARGVRGRIDAVEADMRDFELRREFGLAFVALGTFHHLPTTADQRSALARLARHIRAGGVLILDLINPTPEWLSAADEAVVHHLTRPFPRPDSQDVVSKLVVRSSSFESQLDRQIIYYDRISPDGTVSRSVSRMDLRYLFRYEAEILIAEAGLRIRDLFGGYDLERYDRTSDRMIFVAEKI